MNSYIRKKELVRQSKELKRILNNAKITEKNYHIITQQREEQNKIYKKWLFYDTLLKTINR